MLWHSHKLTVVDANSNEIQDIANNFPLKYVN